MLLQKFKEGIATQDLSFLESLLHEEFLYIEGTDLETKEEWLKQIKEEFEDGFFDVSKMDITVTFETKDMGASELHREENGIWVRVTNVFLYKDDKIYREMVNKVNIEH